MNSSIKEAVKEMMSKIAERIPNKHKKEPVNAYIAGGIAIYYYTASRVSKDVDALIDRDVSIPSKLKVIWINDGEIEELLFDHTYTDTLGIMHEDYMKRAIHQFTIDDKFRVYTLAPEDLIISKLSRFGEQDQEDIKSIITNDLVNKNEFEALARDAIKVAATGRPKTLLLNLQLTLDIFDEYNCI